MHVQEEERRRRGIRARDRGQHVAAANESRPKAKDGCSVVFFRRKQDAVQERHTKSDCCLLLDGLLGTPGTAVNDRGLDCWCWPSASLRSPRFSPAQPSPVELS